MKRDLVAVHLHGPLGERFGTLHHFDIRSPQEAIRALDANYSGFLSAFLEHGEYGLMVDGDWRGGDNAPSLPVSKEMHIVPHVEGNTPLVVIALGFIGITGTTATIIASLLVTGLMIGVSLLFRPKPPQQAEQDKKEADSFIFSGPENVTGQGVAVPLIYGRVFAGSVVVSAGQDTVDTITTTATTGAAPAATGTSTINPVTPGSVLTPPPPEDHGHGDHGRHSKVAARLASALEVTPLLDPEDMLEPWVDLFTEGGGTDHLLDPPIEGWPEIVEDAVYGWRPEGWVLVKTVWATEEDDVNRKAVLIWQPDYETGPDYTYNWNQIKGFYVTEIPTTYEEVIDGVPTTIEGVIATVEPEDEEWIDGAAVEEVPIENPSP